MEEFAMDREGHRLLIEIGAAVEQCVLDLALSNRAASATAGSGDPLSASEIRDALHHLLGPFTEESHGRLIPALRAVGSCRDAA